MNPRIVFFIILFLATTSAYSQEVKLIDGDLSFLKGEKTISTKFIYDNVLIGNDGLREAEYIKRKKSEHEAREPGSGKRWEEAWHSDRYNRFEPIFNEVLQKYSKITPDATAKYILFFETIRIEPGYNVGAAMASSRIDAEVYIVKASAPSDILALISVIDVPGGSGFDAGSRMQEAYSRSAAEIGRLIKKQLK
jgi:hypothetical protein